MNPDKQQHKWRSKVFQLQAKVSKSKRSVSGRRASARNHGNLQTADCGKPVRTDQFNRLVHANFQHSFRQIEIRC